MKVEALTQVSQERARELWQKYQTHKHYQTPADAEIAAIYKRIAQGKTVIRALESIKAAGLNEQGLPKLAIMRADQAVCLLDSRDNQAIFHAKDTCWWHANASRSKALRVPWDGFKLPQGRWHVEATVPLVPVHLRPKRGLASYHVLWEAEWTKRYPVDPYLLRRFGGDAWLVVAAWDLTDVERAVMSSRLRS